ncbi:MAG: glucosylglycerol hydrolase, partial [Cyanobacteria bacterium P01_H01_bin.121]
MTATIERATSIHLNQAATQELLDWAASIQESDATYFEKAQALVTRLGAHYRADGLTEIGFWTPDLMSIVMRRQLIYLEIFTPLEPIDFRAPDQTICFRCDRVPLEAQDEYYWGVLDGLQPGTREQAGSFYWLRYTDQYDQPQIIRDVMAYSLPYGVFGPAELYDMRQLEAERADLAYFQAQGVARQPWALSSDPVPGCLYPLSATARKRVPRAAAPRNILQIHVGTASAAGTVESLTQIYQTLSNKLAQGEALTPAEQNYVSYDAIQL